MLAPPQPSVTQWDDEETVCKMSWATKSSHLRLSIWDRADGLRRGVALSYWGFDSKSMLPHAHLPCSRPRGDGESQSPKTTQALGDGNVMLHGLLFTMCGQSLACFILGVLSRVSGYARPPPAHQPGMDNRCCSLESAHKTSN
ncbi:uncharacterized protein BO95DRAFT_16356 [Aspergillus brunneoviolaceus CBS 621.78]|uniref:Uncharacterized protein n=1 Tax=Aspergillus brunneoviolaceus CBS 621.78 TaxID=1450534 RepID=A0ACD1FTX0_9EURO|nr:hypothetical protein BO95DRAFT_16356 [Aspergillus brunneoviolaceus CBS 621.78]RAH40413.1 hypothetical protein BO95DRAFT_16356 [Aspergillus brunneoviolaceus CBS 621.78]